MAIKIKQLPAKPSSKEINPNQGALPFEVDKQTEIQGIGMGVLTDGTPFLNQRGLARLCGVENAHIGSISSQWNEREQKPRVSTIKTLLASRGIEIDSPHFELQAEGRAMFAYPDTVCLAVIEYYAFEAGANCKDEARHNFRLLAGKALQDFIYTQVGYSPRDQIPIAWQQFHDRVTAAYGGIPNGYFSVFKEAADVIVSLIRAGADVGVHFVPDISIGQHWSKHWVSNGLDDSFGSRRKYPHNYPDYFPQAQSNPQDAHCYPEQALPEFRRWMRDVYLVERLPKYLGTKQKKGDLPASFVNLAISHFQGDEKSLI